MKKLTRILCTLLSALMLLSLIPASADSEPTELIFYFFGEELEDDKVVLAAVNEKLAEKLGCTMKVEYIPFGEFKTTYPLLFASQTKMDAVFTSYWSGYATLATKNAFMPITEEMLKTYAPLTYEDTPESVWDQARVNGTIYMIPQLYIENLQGVVGIRADLREKYGLPEVTDIASLENYMAAVAENETSIVPLLTSTMSSYLRDILMFNTCQWAEDSNYTQLCVAFDITQDAPQPFCYLYTDEYRQALETLYRWNQNGWISKDSLSNTNTNRENMANGKTAVMVDNSGTVNAANEDLKKNGGNERLEMIDLSGDSLLLRYKATGGGLSIPTNSAHPELVLQVIDYLRNDKEMNYLIQRGIYGEDAQWTFAGELNEDGSLNENVIANGARSSLYGGNWICWSAFRNWDYQTLPAEQNCIPGYRQIYADMNDRSINNIMQAFVFDSANYQNELAAIKSVYDEFGAPLTLGFVNPDGGLDQFIQQMEAAGLKTVLNAYYEQAAAYLEANK